MSGSDARPALSEPHPVPSSEDDWQAVKVFEDIEEAAAASWDALRTRKDAPINLKLGSFLSRLDTLGPGDYSAIVIFNEPPAAKVVSTLIQLLFLVSGHPDLQRDEHRQLQSDLLTTVLRSLRTLFAVKSRNIPTLLSALSQTAVQVKQDESTLHDRFCQADGPQALQFVVAHLLTRSSGQFQTTRLVGLKHCVVTFLQLIEELPQWDAACFTRLFIPPVGSNLHVALAAPATRHLNQSLLDLILEGCLQTEQNQFVMITNKLSAAALLVDNPTLRQAMLHCNILHFIERCWSLVAEKAPPRTYHATTTAAADAFLLHSESFLGLLWSLCKDDPENTCLMLQRHALMCQIDEAVARSLGTTQVVPRQATGKAATSTSEATSTSVGATGTAVVSRETVSPNVGDTETLTGDAAANHAQSDGFVGCPVAVAQQAKSALCKMAQRARSKGMARGMAGTVESTRPPSGPELNRWVRKRICCYVILLAGQIECVDQHQRMDAAEKAFQELMAQDGEAAGKLPTSSAVTSRKSGGEKAHKKGKGKKK